jgi:hypothetical protein
MTLKRPGALSLSPLKLARPRADHVPRQARPQAAATAAMAFSTWKPSALARDGHVAQRDASRQLPSTATMCAVVDEHAALPCARCVAISGQQCGRLQK